MNASDRARQQLAEIVGSDHVVVDNPETLTISPSETEEVSGVLSFSKDNNFMIFRGERYQAGLGEVGWLLEFTSLLLVLIG